MRLNRRCVSKGYWVVLLAGLAACTALGQSDPGVRPGAAGAGGVYPGLNREETAYFPIALEIFSEVDSVSGTSPGEEGKGLGPMFNGNSCAQCHVFPAVGGSRSQAFHRCGPEKDGLPERTL